MEEKEARWPSARAKRPCADPWLVIADGAGWSESMPAVPREDLTRCCRSARVGATLTKDCDTLSPSERISLWGIRFRRWLGGIVRRFLRPGSAVVAAVDAVYAISQILREEEVPSASAWKVPHPLGWLLAVSGGIALVGTLLVFLGFDRVLRRTSKDDELLVACKGVWRLAVEKLGLPMDKVGVHVWSVRGIKGFRYLSRRATFVIRPRRRSAHIIWRKGKGAIGIAWDEDEGIIANVENLQARGPSQRLFCAIPRRDRFGLGWHEFRRMRHYRGILAVPLRVRGDVRGCLSVDIQVDGRADDLDTLATDEGFADVLRVCEAVLEKRG